MAQSLIYMYVMFILYRTFRPSQSNSLCVSMASSDVTPRTCTKFKHLQPTCIRPPVTLLRSLQQHADVHDVTASKWRLTPSAGSTQLPQLSSAPADARFVSTKRDVIRAFPFCSCNAPNKCTASPPTSTCNHDVTEWRTCSQWTLRIPSLPSVFWSAKSINKRMLSKILLCASSVGPLQLVVFVLVPKFEVRRHFQSNTCKYCTFIKPVSQPVSLMPCLKCILSLITNFMSLYENV